jgi:hypothetical protein
MQINHLLFSSRAYLLHRRGHSVGPWGCQSDAATTSSTPAAFFEGKRSRRCCFRPRWAPSEHWGSLVRPLDNGMCANHLNTPDINRVLQFSSPKTGISLFSQGIGNYSCANIPSFDGDNPK